MYKQEENDEQEIQTSQTILYLTLSIYLQSIAKIKNKKIKKDF